MHNPNPDFTALERMALERRMAITLYEVAFYNPQRQLAATVQIRTWQPNAETKARFMHNFPAPQWECTSVHALQTWH
jgi:hypothetical protein